MSHCHSLEIRSLLFQAVTCWWGRQTRSVLWLSKSWVFGYGSRLTSWWLSPPPQLPPSEWWDSLTSAISYEPASALLAGWRGEGFKEAGGMALGGVAKMGVVAWAFMTGWARRTPHSWVEGTETEMAGQLTEPMIEEWWKVSILSEHLVIPERPASYSSWSTAGSHERVLMAFWKWTLALRVWIIGISPCHL